MIISVGHEHIEQPHACRRDCTTNAIPLTCVYHFKVEWYRTLSKVPTRWRHITNKRKILIRAKF